MSRVITGLRRRYRQAKDWRTQRRTSLRYRQIHRKFSDFTMMPLEDYGFTLQLAEQIRNVPGCIVECGVWKGGMAAGLASVLGSEREYFLFDSFEGLPAAKEIDGPAALRWQSRTDDPGYLDNCRASREHAEMAMRLAKIQNYHVVPGWFGESLKSVNLPSPIALLHLDADWYESTMMCLTRFFEQVAPDGLIVLDDYHAWDGCSRALHDFLSSHSAIERIKNLGNVCYLKKHDSQTEFSKHHYHDIRSEISS